VKEINRFIQEPDTGEKCPRYEYRQYDTEYGLITVAVNLCEAKESEVEARFSEEINKILEDLRTRKEFENQTVEVVNEDGRSYEV